MFVRFVLFFLLGTFASLTIVSANGGGVYANSSVVRATDPSFRFIKDVYLISEKLLIRPVGPRCEVTVKYVLQNTSAKDYVNLDYAFPVDDIGMSNDEDEKTMVQSLEFLLNGKPLPHAISKDTGLVFVDFFEKTDQEWSFNLMSLQNRPLNRRWFYTQVTLPKHSFASLEVRYSIETLNLCDGNSPLLLDYDFHGCTTHNLFYDFSPASHWGDGIIRDFYVEIDAADLKLTGEPYRKAYDPVEGIYDQLIWAEGLPFEKIGDKYVCRMRNFDLKKAQPLLLTYHTSSTSSLDIISKRRIPNDAYTIKVSSEQKKYPASHLTDMNLETAWVPVKSKGEQIEFIFKKPMQSVSGFSLLNGYHKNAETYHQNNRVKVLKVEIKQIGEADWRTMDYPETLEDKPYYPVFFSDLFFHAELIDFWDTIDTEKPIERIRFTIEDVYPGSKFDDSCISEIILYR